MSREIGRTQCPKCLDSGQDNLVLYDDGHSYCHACSYSEGTKQVVRQKGREVLYLPKDASYVDGIPHRGITVDTCRKAGVMEKVVYDKKQDHIVLDENGQPVPKGIIVFPFYDDKKRLLGLKYRDFWSEVEQGADKNTTIKFRGELTLGGLHTLQGKNELCIWEGEIDWLTAMQCDDTRDHLFIPGVKSVKFIKQYSNIIRRYQKIFIGFDNDTAGDDAREAVLETLPVSKLHFIDYDKYNDLNEAYLADENSYARLIAMAYQETTDTLLTGDELVQQFVLYFAQRKTMDYISTKIKVIDDMLGGGLTPGEVLGLVSHTGVGKTTLCCGIADSTAEAGIKSMIGGTEMQVVQYMMKLIEIRTGKRFVKKRFDEGWTIDEQVAVDVAKELSKDFVFYSEMLYDWDKFEAAIIDAIYKHSIRVLYIDVLSDVLTTDWQRNEYIMQRINWLAAGDINDNRPPISIVNVCHTKSIQGLSAKKVTIEQVVGGKSVRQKSTCMIAMEGDPSSESTQRNLKLLKRSRMNDSLVTSGVIDFSREDRRYVDVEIESRDYSNEPDEGSRGKVRRSEDDVPGNIRSRFHTVPRRGGWTNRARAL